MKITLPASAVSLPGSSRQITPFDQRRSHLIPPHLDERQKVQNTNFVNDLAFRHFSFVKALQDERSSTDGHSKCLSYEMPVG